MASSYKPKKGNIKIKTIESHAAGEPLRVILEGYPQIPGRTILEKRRFLRENLDYLRTALMWEPRGHADMYGALLTEPEREDSDIGVIFMHNEGYSTMCGHGVIALTTVLLETGMVKKGGDETTVKMDTPAGQVIAVGHLDKGRVKEVSFQNVPSFLSLRDQEVQVDGIGRVKFDLAFGGAFYAFVNAEEIGIGLSPQDFRQLIDWGMRIKRAVSASFPVIHPFQEDLSFLYGTIFVGKPHDPQHHSRNVCIFAEGEVDRSPTGTGVSARTAIHYFKGELGLNQPFTVESIIGSCFTGKALSLTNFGPYEAVIPEVRGSASITGFCEWTIDPGDPFAHGFILR